MSDNKNGISEALMVKATEDYKKFKADNGGDYKYRFCYEFAELTDRMESLKAVIEKYIRGEPVGFETNPERMERLKRQLKYMGIYHAILTERLLSGSL
jgi:hypothetical protein